MIIWLTVYGLYLRTLADRCCTIFYFYFHPSTILKREIVCFSFLSLFPTALISLMRFIVKHIKHRSKIAQTKLHWSTIDYQYLTIFFGRDD